VHVYSICFKNSIELQTFVNCDNIALPLMFVHFILISVTLPTGAHAALNPVELITSGGST